MPPRLASDPAFDRHMMQWLVVFSSSERGRRAAEAWLAAFEAARQAGADEAAAYAQANTEEEHICVEHEA
ncbi:MAG: hypothetical protein JOZ81_27980 [Chloroflexi bacterium]|nr:hypothetical protein [Chloroflexota bacterium]MBV9547904.1 hypothetical protein [Chloroflexota bacterium]